MKYHSASEIGFVTALSPGHIATAGSSNASNLGKYSWGQLVVLSGSLNNLVVKMERATASSGTFAAFGASMATTAGSGFIYSRSFGISSAVWHRVAYDNNNAGSVNAAVFLVLYGADDVPLNPQPAGGKITIFSEVPA